MIGLNYNINAPASPIASFCLLNPFLSMMGLSVEVEYVTKLEEAGIWSDDSPELEEAALHYT